VPCLAGGGSIDDLVRNAGDPGAFGPGGIVGSGGITSVVDNGCGWGEGGVGRGDHAVAGKDGASEAVLGEVDELYPIADNEWGLAQCARDGDHLAAGVSEPVALLFIASADIAGVPVGMEDEPAYPGRGGGNFSGFEESAGGIDDREDGDIAGLDAALEFELAEEHGQIADILGFDRMRKEDAFDEGAEDRVEVIAQEARAGMVDGDEGRRFVGGGPAERGGHFAAEGIERARGIGKGEEDGIGLGAKGIIEPGAGDADGNNAAQAHGQARPPM